MEQLSGTELAEEVLYTVDAQEGGDGEEARLFADILDGSATARRTTPPLPAEQHLEYEEKVYELSIEITEQTPATRYSILVDIVTDSVEESATVRFENLPEVDKKEFAAHGLADGEVIGIGTTFLYTDTEQEQSVLVPDPKYSYIRWDEDTEAEWVVDDAYDTTLNTYRYTASQVATAAEYGRKMRKQFAFELADLPEAQQEIIQTAIEEGDYVVEPETTPSGALTRLADRFREQEQVRALDETGEGDLSGPYLVRYDGEVYWTVFLARSKAFETENEITEQT
jgi:hypothetical protein